VVLGGTKTWISNGGIADFYCVFAKTDPGAGTRGITAFIVDADTPGLDSSEHIAVMAPHPLATLRFNDCKVPGERATGRAHGGFKLAMQTLDIFRASVAGAALGMARRALPKPWPTHGSGRCLARRWPTSSSPRPSWARWRRWWTLPPC
jgi:acyl-CoA dehydrogenase